MGADRKPDGLLCDEGIHSRAASPRKLCKDGIECDPQSESSDGIQSPPIIALSVLRRAGLRETWPTRGPSPRGFALCNIQNPRGARSETWGPTRWGL